MVCNILRTRNRKSHKKSRTYSRELMDYCLRNGGAKRRRFLWTKSEITLYQRAVHFSIRIVSPLDKTNNTRKINILFLMARARAYTLQLHGFAHRRCHTAIKINAIELKRMTDRRREKERERSGRETRSEDRNKNGKKKNRNWLFNVKRRRCIIMRCLIKRVRGVTTTCLSIPKYNYRDYSPHY